MSGQLGLFGDNCNDQDPTASYEELAEKFCADVPYKTHPFNKRNWGGPLHSLCSYQGKLKPSIAHVLVRWFTSPGQTIYDPMSGVGTIPLEARRQGRIALGNDLSPLAYAVTSAKIEPIDRERLRSERDRLVDWITMAPPLSELASSTDTEWGLNRPIAEYFHVDTLREILAARQYFLSADAPNTPEANLLRSSVMHILHGNRPYALSRRSHPVTPFAPTGETEYRGLSDRLDQRLGRVVPDLIDLAGSAHGGRATQLDFRVAPTSHVDAVITSPPFSKSLRFWSSNWMRLWFAGWEPEDFKSQPDRYLEKEQQRTFEPYADFAQHIAKVMPTGSRLILHLGETASVRMSDAIAPLLAPYFELVHVGREDVTDTESHGLRDKGATLAHWYVFAERSGFAD